MYYRKALLLKYKRLLHEIITGFNLQEKREKWMTCQCGYSIIPRRCLKPLTGAAQVGIDNHSFYELSYSIIRSVLPFVSR